MDNFLKITLSEVLRGYSCINTIEYGNIFIKHFSLLDSAEIDLKYSDYYDKALSLGAPVESDRVDFLLKDGQWTEEKDQEIAIAELFIKNLTQTKSKLHIDAQRKVIDQQIADNQNKLNELNNTKNILIGITAERYARKKISELSIFNSYFKDKLLTNPLFNQEEADDVEYEQISKLIRYYNLHFQYFESKHLKKIALSPIFTNSFYLCEDDPYIFFGKPVINLTFYQSELFGYGRYFKFILSQSEVKPPPHIAEDPDELIDWYETTNNIQKVLSKSTEGGTTLVMGASKKDIQRMGSTDGQIDLIKEAQKRGGTLDFNEMLKLNKQI